MLALSRPSTRVTADAAAHLYFTIVELARLAPRLGADTDTVKELVASFQAQSVASNTHGDIVLMHLASVARRMVEKAGVAEQCKEEIMQVIFMAIFELVLAKVPVSYMC